MPRQSKEFENFDSTMSKLLTVSHADIKAKLDAEKAEKRKRKPKASASGRASGGKG
jgi:hypothetical protein